MCFFFFLILCNTNISSLLPGVRAPLVEYHCYRLLYWAVTWGWIKRSLKGLHYTWIRVKMKCNILNYMLCNIPYIVRVRMTYFTLEVVLTWYNRRSDLFNMQLAGCMLLVTLLCFLREHSKWRNNLRTLSCKSWDRKPKKFWILVNCLFVEIYIILLTHFVKR